MAGFRFRINQAMNIKINKGPCIEKADRKRSGKAQTTGIEQATVQCGDFQLNELGTSPGNIMELDFCPRKLDSQAGPWQRTSVLDVDTKGCTLTRKNGVGFA